ncbi:MAG: glycosyltransferase family 2 protein [Rubrivivax sp.]|jgi:glycosyltransferase involved in cell wall biosynthesis
MKVSIITVAYNSAATIRDTIESVRAQEHPNIEHIVVDGVSSDGTVDIVRSYGSDIAHFISEPDTGIYDAMNKGIALATGEVVGILNSDDLYAHSQVISHVVAALERSSADCCFADLVYVSGTQLDKVVRYYSSASFHPGRFAWGWMPAHPTVFLKRRAYEAHGVFRTDFRIAADFELMIRFLACHQLPYVYVPEVWVKMRTGGISTSGMASNLLLNREIVRACRDNGINTSLPQVMIKYFSKLFQLVRRPARTVGDPNTSASG